ncbi:MAG: DNA methyltransferase [bacterium]
MKVERKMTHSRKISVKDEQELQKAILREKAKGISDMEIGNKYGVTFRYVENLITKSQGINVSALNSLKKIKSLNPKFFKEEQNTVWSFKQRGNWATHSGEYRGNWSPYIPRNILLKYSRPGELVLDYFCGAGTTAVEAKLLGRRCIALDINDKAIELAKRNVHFGIEQEQLDLFGDDKALKIYEPELLVGDARYLEFLKNNSIDMICSHPPYANIINYTNSKNGDLSFYGIDEFLAEMSKVAEESFRILKPGRQCAILIGDTRKKKHIIPLGFKLINIYLNAGFKLRELIIKRQHNCKTTGFWCKNSVKYNFLLLAHEYLPIFEKTKTVLGSNVKERDASYSVIAPVTEKPALSKKLNELETTTVWVLQEKEFEKQLNKNVIERYSKGNGHLTVSFNSGSNHTFLFGEKRIKNKGLLFIKSSFLSHCHSKTDIEIYLNKINEIIKEDSINKDGYLIIQTRDVRLNGYIEPVAKILVDMLTDNKNLWLKEIVIVVPEKQNHQNNNPQEYLNIEHQYLLVYEYCIFSDICLDERKILNAPNSISIEGRTGWKSGKTSKGGGGGISS